MTRKVARDMLWEHCRSVGKVPTVRTWNLMCKHGGIAVLHMTEEELLKINQVGPVTLTEILWLSGRHPGPDYSSHI